MRASNGIFAGGDMIGGARTMTAAVGHGKKAARNIDAWLRGGVYEKPALVLVIGGHDEVRPQVGVRDDRQAAHRGLAVVRHGECDLHDDETR